MMADVDEKLCRYIQRISLHRDAILACQIYSHDYSPVSLPFMSLYDPQARYIKSLSCTM
jgi:hypothetical protein